MNHPKAPTPQTEAVTTKPGFEAWWGGVHGLTSRRFSLLPGQHLPWVFTLGTHLLGGVLSCFLLYFVSRGREASGHPLTGGWLAGDLTDMLDCALRSLGPSPALCFGLCVPPSPLGAGATPDPAPRGPWRGHSLTTSQACTGHMTAPALVSAHLSPVPFEMVLLFTVISMSS